VPRFLDVWDGRLASMGDFTKPALDDLLGRGCSCGSSKLEFMTYVDARFTLMQGDQFGGVTWAYKGETFVDGIFEVSCIACKEKLFSSDVCPRCNRANAITGVLESKDTFVIPTTCGKCDRETLLYTVMLPARVVYEGGRAQKARASVDLVEEGVHGVQISCKACGVLAEVTGSCPLCASTEPLRPRPD
jgi:hypothetical protein